MRELVLMFWDLPSIIWEMPWQGFLLYGLGCACGVWLFWAIRRLCGR